MDDEELLRISNEVLDDLEAVSPARSLNPFPMEPFISRVDARDEDGVSKTFYFSRDTPKVLAAKHGKLASYHAPMGRLAEAFVGDWVTIRRPAGTTEFVIVTSSKLRPRRAAQWDSIENRVSLGHGQFTIASLRAYSEQHALKRNEDDLEAILADLADSPEDMSPVIEAGFRRATVERMALRDQPILDRYQGEIFRLPLDCRLFLLGPPGTGKTTTLIRRIAQKASRELVLEEVDVHSEAVDELFPANGNNWLMFTPTDLLKLYLKEAFNAERLAAPEDNIQTWDEKRRLLARNTFTILRGAGTGRYTLRDDIQRLRATTSAELCRFYEAFAAYRVSALVAELAGLRDYILAAGIAGSDADEIARNLTFTAVGRVLETTAQRWAQIDEIRRADERRLDSAIREALGKVVRLALRDGGRSRIDAIVQQVGAANRFVYERPQAARDLESAIRDLVRRKLAGQGPPVGRNADILRAAEATDLEIPPGELDHFRVLFAARSAWTRLANIDDVLVLSATGHYEDFRCDSANSEHYAIASEAPSTELTEPELDVILLSMLESASFISRAGLSTPLISRFRTEQRTHIVVDEATDFSSVQLRCMLLLARAPYRAFAAAGDFKQRVRKLGLRSEEDIRWVDPHFDTRSVSISYRQSSRLNDLALRLADLQDGQAFAVTQPQDLIEDDIPPLIAENLQGDALAAWLVQRISEIETALRNLPSVALFVPNEESVDPLHAVLAPRLAELNLRCVACRGGRDVGNSNEVRIFDVHHIKGLEFEAVFFVDVDLLVARAPDEFLNFLFLGVTRAASYLGLTSSAKFPEPLASVRPLLVEGVWQ